MRLAYVTNLPAPYRVSFLNELGRLCELTVFFERRSASDRDKSWRAEQARNYREVYCDDRPIGADKSFGLDLTRRVRAAEYDRLLLSGYSSPAVMALILDCQRRKQAYYMQYDGGFDRGRGIKTLLKQKLLRPAAGHFTSSDVHTDYLRNLGVSPELIWKYPFTSLSEEDILSKPISEQQREQLRLTLGITERKAVLAVGQFIPRKGFDILLEAARRLRDPELGFYFVGGEATADYTRFCRENNLTQAHFIGFQQKQALRAWYQAADVFCLPTREDIWGLVVNEAMANGLPVVTTTACGAGLELVREDCGAVVVPEDPEALCRALRYVLDADLEAMRLQALNTIRSFTVQNMARLHAAHLL